VQIFSKILSAIIVIGILWYFVYEKSAIRDGNDVVIVEGVSSVFQTQIGDCLRYPSDDAEFTSITLVPCSTAHNSEIYYKLEVNLPAFDEDQIGLIADEECVMNFEEYVGIAYSDSIYYFDVFMPTLGSWNEASDRTIDCLIVSIDDEDLLGSVKNTKL
jgi:hypothetical protein